MNRTWAISSLISFLMSLAMTAILSARLRGLYTILPSFKRGARTPLPEVRGPKLAGRIGAVSEGGPSGRFQGSVPGEICCELLRFGYGKAANDKKVPDRVGSGCYRRKRPTPTVQRRTSNSEAASAFRRWVFGVGRSMFAFSPLVLVRIVILFRAPRFLCHI